METIKRRVKSGAEYDHLFPKVKGRTHTEKRDANVDDTVRFIPKVVQKTLHQTAEVAPLLKGKNLYETCRNVWEFAYQHITYEKDAHGVEQIRSPARTWADRHNGVDCDCYTTFICSVLANLKVKGVVLRITKYKEDRFQHIYPIVKTENGRYITLDCVVHRFDYEEPYSEKKDYPMDLQFLDGIDEEDLMADEFGGGEFGELGRGKLKAFVQKTVKKVSTAVKNVPATVKKAVHVVNRVNPATLLLRNGVLAAMKINMMKVAGKLRWAFLSEQQANQKGITTDKYRKLKAVMQKLEKIFYGAGGKPENLKKAILTGRGNTDKQVLAGLSGLDLDIGYLSENMPLDALLGADIYYSENVEGLGELGEPVSTTAAVAAASGAIAAIALSIKQIGDLFPKGSKLNESGNEESGSNTLPASIEEDSTPTENRVSESSGDAGDEKAGFWEKNKSWLKPTLIAATGATVLYLGYKMTSKKKSLNGLAGAPKKKGTKVKAKRAKGSRKKPTAVALM